MTIHKTIICAAICGCVAACIQPLAEHAAEPVSITGIELQRIETAQAPGDDPQRNPDWTLILRVDDWLALRTRVSPAAITLSVDGVEIPAETSWDPVDRTLRTAFRAPSAGRLDLVLDPERLPTLDGRLVESETVVLRLEDAPAVQPAETPPPVRFAADLQDPLDASCRACHGPSSSLPALRPDTLRNVPSRHVQGRSLVEPGEPARSVALHLMIDGYPVPEGRRKPPLWADPVPPALPDDFAARFARWIAEGARDN